MSRILFPVYLKDEETKTWLTKLGRGYALDGSMALMGFDADQEGFELYTKVFPVPAARPAAPVVTAAPAPLTAPAPAPVSTAAVVPPTPPTVDTAAAISETTPTEVDVDSVIAELKALYIKENPGKTPNEEMVNKWRSEVENVQTSELLASAASPSGEEVEGGWLRI